MIACYVYNTIKNNYIQQKIQISDFLLKIINLFVLKRCFCPQDMIGLLRSNLGIVLFRKFPLVRPRFIYSEKSWLIRIQLPKGFLGLRIVECKNSSDLLE